MVDERQSLVKNGAHIGAQRKVKPMEKFIFRVRPDGLSIINVQVIIDRIKVAAKMIAAMDPKDVLIVTNKEQAFKPATKFAELTGAESEIGRFLPGTMTNPNQEYFVEPKLVFVADTYGDKQALEEAYQMRVPVIALASTNNTYNKVDLVVPCNNKGRRSLAAVYWLLTQEVLKARGELSGDVVFSEKLEDFMDEETQVSSFS
ncbi:MAG: 30S ribosomal protein S2 [Candidatus Altiarchaeota archaeon]|nr:30S ribosomal protein S2 [Candidatus Altiarchaeota archaeon]